MSNLHLSAKADQLQFRPGNGIDFIMNLQHEYGGQFVEKLP